MIFTPVLWVLGCARDCGRHLPSVFRNLDQLRPWFSDVQVLLLENDSRDDTLQQIRAYADARAGIQARGMPGLDDQIPVRTERLAHLRNACMGWLQRQGGLKGDDLVLVLDCDEVNAGLWDVNRWPQLFDWFLGRQDAAAMFPNQRGPYYDLWALRHPDRCPVDVWQQVLELHCRHPELSDAALIEQAYHPWQFSVNPAGLPEAVESAFGGLGFYKTRWLRRNAANYCGSISRWIDHSEEGTRLIRWQVAEHVAFHAGLRAQGGTLWLQPALVNWTTALLPDLRPNPSAWRQLSF